MRRAALIPIAFLLAATAAAGVPEVAVVKHGPALRIAVIGDIGSGPAAAAKGLARIHATAPLDAIVVTGDNIYPCGVSSPADPSWDRIRGTLSTLGIPIYPVLGNHDYGEPTLTKNGWHPCRHGDPGAQVGIDSVPHWVFPARDYLIRSDVATFAMIDTTPIVLGASSPVLGSRSASEVRSDLRAMLQEGKGWHIVVGHHVIFSSGWHGQFPRDQGNRMRALIPLLREGHADLYICGHDHHLELIGPMSPRGRRPLFLVSGAGSEPISPIGLRYDTLFPTSRVRATIGFAILDITDRMLGITFYRADGTALSERYVFLR
ncbi:MAG TPA: metallophosphoesterase [Thermoanaerobaculia bacterium]|nr:metallophosphoesterase [Thermoanaerobaculia bacterium]